MEGCVEVESKGYGKKLGFEGSRMKDVYWTIVKDKDTRRGYMTKNY